MLIIIIINNNLYLLLASLRSQLRSTIVRRLGLSSDEKILNFARETFKDHLETSAEIAPDIRGDVRFWIFFSFYLKIFIIFKFIV